MGVSRRSHKAVGVQAGVGQSVRHGTHRKGLVLSFCPCWVQVAPLGQEAFFPPRLPGHTWTHCQAQSKANCINRAGQDGIWDLESAPAYQVCGGGAEHRVSAVPSQAPAVLKPYSFEPRGHSEVAWSRQQAHTARKRSDWNQTSCQKPGHSLFGKDRRALRSASVHMIFRI